MKRKKRRDTEILGPEGFYTEAPPFESTRDLDTIRREYHEAAERARAEETRLAALPDSARTIVLGGDADLVLDEFSEGKDEGIVQRGGSVWKFRIINS